MRNHFLRAAAGGVIATGGNSVYDITVGSARYRVHEFTSVGSQNFIVSNGGEIEYLLVAGGGSGGAGYGLGAGGGGGGVIHKIGHIVANGTYPITVGARGPSNGGSQPGVVGGNSTGFGVIAYGGGRGGYLSNGGDGGSGGGANSTSHSGGSSIQTSQDGATGYGSFGEDSATQFVGGAGGGAGGDNVSFTRDGIEIAITGAGLYYGGGGAEAGDTSGSLGGGAGSPATPAVGLSGTPNTGGGGSGGWDNNRAGGAGGSGIVIIRYLI